MRAFLLFIILISSSAMAVEQAQTQNIDLDVKRLIQFVEHSNCQFVRNGKPYSPRKSAMHIEKKYQHFKAEINSIDKFIELAASKSMLSGRPYQVVCPNSEPVSAGIWMRMMTRDLGLKLDGDIAI